MSKIEVDTIDTQSSTTLQVGSTNTALIKIGTSGDTVEYPAGTTFTQSGTQNVTAGGAINVKSGGNITIDSGATITNNGTATGFSADLTNLNATNLTSGTVPDARFPATLPIASGSALTNLNATNLGSGTIPDARFPAALPAISGAALTNLPAGGSMTLIKTLTASSSSTLSFVNGTASVVLDSTYKHYVFEFNTIHGSASSAALTFQGSVDTGSNYNTNILSCVYVNYASGSGGDHTLEKRNNNQDGTGFQMLTEQNSVDADASWSGELHIFNPGSTTFRKSFRGCSTGQTAGDYHFFMNVAGRMETTSAVDAIQFKMASGNIDSGTISLYGITS